LALATAGWSPATKGTLRAPVVGIDAQRAEDLLPYKGRLKGAIVIIGRPQEMVLPTHPLLTPWAEEPTPFATPKVDPSKPSNPEERARLQQALRKLLADEGVGAILAASEKSYGLQMMWSVGRDFEPGSIPMAILPREDYTLLWRLLDTGPVEMEVNLESSFSGKPVEVYNTVAEIPGNEKPEEVVMIGAHLDSWDLGTGATDNGTGSMAVLAAARALQKLEVKPKRTIRFVLFTGEEEGLQGSKAYVKVHAKELPKISAMLVHDTGTGKVPTIELMRNYAAKETIDRSLYPLAQAKGIGLAEPSLRIDDGSDHMPFDEAGVPAFICMQEYLDYDKSVHSQADTIDRVRWDDLTEGAQVLAVFAYSVAQLPEMLPRKPAKTSGN